MVFLDELRRYLERPEAPGAVFAPDVAVHRRRVLEALERLEKEGRSEEELRREHRFWTPERVARFARAMGTWLKGGLGHGASAGEITAWINVALDRHLGLESSTGSKVKDWEADRLRVLELAGTSSEGAHEVAEYALKIRAVRREGDGRRVTAIGRLILELPDRDALRWMLAAEVVQSRGPEDEWRMARASAASLLEDPEGSRDLAEDDVSWPVPWKLLRRLSRMDIVEIEDDYETDVVTYALRPLGRALLEEVSSGKETPFTLLVQALLQDEAAAIVGQFRAAGAAGTLDGTADATARHARMVAHEIRNALVPVQSALDALYRDVGRHGTADLVEKRRDAIDGGIDRVFTFLRDISRIADLASTPSELFDVEAALRAAIAASDTGLTIPFEPACALPAVKGHRDRFVLAVVNLLRNAAQARSDEGLEIRVTAGTHNGAEVFVLVDDNGPGVPVEHRTNIFKPGFSLRAGGTGQGLSLVREVVEEEMAGRVTCEESPLGGARMSVRLPIGARRTQ